MKSTNNNSLKKFEDYLRVFSTKENPTNTSIKGGKWLIPPENYEQFVHAYYNDVIHRGKVEHLTEKQLQTKGPILIDMDIHQDEKTSTRMYTEENIEETVTFLVGKLERIYQLHDTDVKFNIYILEKPACKYDTKHKIHKDGIHIIVGIQSDLVTQELLRRQMLTTTELADIYKNVPIINPWTAVLDEGVAKGHANWQMYGSRKPDCEPYRLTYLYEVGYDESAQHMTVRPQDTDDFPMRERIFELSARYDRHPYFMFTEEFIDIRAKHEDQNQRVAAAAASAVTSAPTRVIQLSNTYTNSFSIVQALLSMSSKDDIRTLTHEFLDELIKDKESLGFELREIYEYVMCLPISYYGPGSYDKWIRVGWVLKNTDDRLFLVWVMFSSQSSSFQMTDLMDLYDRWQGFQQQNNE